MRAYLLFGEAIAAIVLFGVLYVIMVLVFCL